MPDSTPVGVLVLDAHQRAAPGADAEEDGVEARRASGSAIVKSLPRTTLVVSFDAEVEDLGDLEVEHVLGQAVLGDAVAQHAARLGLALEDRARRSP